MKSLVIVAVLLMSMSAFAADAFHVTGVREWSPSDPAPVSRGPRVYVITGTVNGVQVTAQQMFTFGSQHLDVGQDYEVSKSDRTRLTVVTHDKKGRNVEERLVITSVQEVQ